MDTLSEEMGDQVVAAVTTTHPERDQLDILLGRLLPGPVVPASPPVGFGAIVTKVAERGSGSAANPAGTSWTFGHRVLATESTSRLFCSGSTGAAGSHETELEYGGVFFVW